MEYVVPSLQEITHNNIGLLLIAIITMTEWHFYKSPCDQLQWNSDKLPRHPLKLLRFGASENSVQTWGTLGDKRLSCLSCCQGSCVTWWSGRWTSKLLAQWNWTFCLSLPPSREFLSMLLMVCENKALFRISAYYNKGLVTNGYRGNKFADWRITNFNRI